MGLSIISIVVFHFTEDCHDSGINYSWLIRFFYTKLGSSSVDVFVILSGFGLFFALKNNPNIINFYLKRYKRVLIPYLIVAVPSWIARDIFIEDRSISFLLNDLTFISNKTWFWFIRLILIAYLFYPLLFRVIDKQNSHVYAFIVTAAIYVVITTITYYLYIYKNDIYDGYQIMLLRFPHFALGCFLGRLSYHEVSFNKKYLIVGALLLVPCYFLLHSDLAITLRYTRAYINVFLCICFIIIFDLIKESPIKDCFTNILRFFGGITLELYLVHVALRYFFFKFSHPTYQYYNELIMIMISIVIAYFLNKLLKSFV